VKITSRKREDVKPKGLHPRELIYGVLYEAIDIGSGEFWSYASLVGPTIVQGYECAIDSDWVRIIKDICLRDCLEVWEVLVPHDVPREYMVINGTESPDSVAVNVLGMRFVMRSLSHIAPGHIIVVYRDAS
jgi:hypothetical protein